MATPSAEAERETVEQQPLPEALDIAEAPAVDPIDKKIDAVLRVIDRLPEMEVEKARRIVAKLLSDRFVEHEPQDTIVGMYLKCPDALRKRFNDMRPPSKSKPRTSEKTLPAAEKAAAEALSA